MLQVEAGRNLNYMAGEIFYEDKLTMTIGLSVGCVVFVAILTLTIVLSVRHVRKSRKRKDKDQFNTSDFILLPDIKTDFHNYVNQPAFGNSKRSYTDMSRLDDEASGFTRQKPTFPRQHTPTDAMATRLPFSSRFGTHEQTTEEHDLQARIPMRMRQDMNANVSAPNSDVYRMHTMHTPLSTDDVFLSRQYWRKSAPIDEELMAAQDQEESSPYVLAYKNRINHRAPGSGGTDKLGASEADGPPHRHNRRRGNRRSWRNPQDAESDIMWQHSYIIQYNPALWPPRESDHLRIKDTSIQ